MTSLLAERDLTAEERAAVADEPRPGVWVQDGVSSATADYQVHTEHGDGRILTQETTDALIAAELAFRSRAMTDSERDEVRQVVGHPRYLRLGDRLPKPFDANQQRGGLHSDPLVRLLAYRAWGERDRRWFDLEVGHRVLVLDGEHSLRQGEVVQLAGQLPPGMTEEMRPYMTSQIAPPGSVMVRLDAEAGTREQGGRGGVVIALPIAHLRRTR